MGTEVEALKVQIEAQIAIFQTDSEAYITKGNKAAAKRSRQASLELGRLFKSWRKESMA